MRLLLAVTAVLETITGIALLGFPGLSVSILLHASLDLAAGVVICRVGGAALIALGFVCWCAHQDGRSRAAIGVIKAMLFYNVAAVLILAYARLGESVGGIVLWLAVILHGALAVWCIVDVRSGTGAAFRRSSASGI